jgi:hypothetical protein
MCILFLTKIAFLPIQKVLEADYQYIDFYRVQIGDDFSKKSYSGLFPIWF